MAGRGGFGRVGWQVRGQDGRDWGRGGGVSRSTGRVGGGHRHGNVGRGLVRVIGQGGAVGWGAQIQDREAWVDAMDKGN